MYSDNEIRDAFKQWCQRVDENPDDFLDYGDEGYTAESGADYLISILEELKVK